MQKTFFDAKLIVKTGDITSETVDAIVNAANSTLLGGGGVDGAIHAKGGRSILEECRMVRAAGYPDGLPTGMAVMTTGGNLPAKYVIHTVGPVFGDHNGTEAKLLADCYRNSVELAAEHGLASIAFPSISTGAFGYPKQEAAKVIGTTLADLLPSAGIEVRLVFFAESDFQIFMEHSGLKD